MTESTASGRGPARRREIEMEVVLRVRQDAGGRTSARVLTTSSGLDFGVAALGDLPLLLEALLTDVAPP